MRLLSGILLLLLVAATGCASKVRPVGEWGAASSGFSGVNEEGLRIEVEQPQEQTWARFFPSPKQLSQLRRKDGKSADPTPVDFGLDPETSRPLLLVIAESEWAAPEKMDPDDRAEILFTLRERIYRYSLRAYGHPVRVRWAYDPRDPLLQGYRVVTVNSRVTDVSRGNGLLRYVIGYGAGAVALQFEGELCEGTGPDARRIGAFVSRVHHGGYSQGGWNPDVYLASYCSKYAVEVGVTKLMERLPELLPGAVTAEPRPDPTVRIAVAN